MRDIVRTLARRACVSRGAYKSACAAARYRTTEENAESLRGKSWRTAGDGAGRCGGQRMIHSNRSRRKASRRKLAWQAHAGKGSSNSGFAAVRFRTMEENAGSLRGKSWRTPTQQRKHEAPWIEFNRGDGRRLVRQVQPGSSTLGGVRSASWLQDNRKKRRESPQARLGRSAMSSALGATMLRWSRTKRHMRARQAQPCTGAIGSASKAPRYHPAEGNAGSLRGRSWRTTGDSDDRCGGQRLMHPNRSRQKASRRKIARQVQLCSCAIGGASNAARHHATEENDRSVRGRSMSPMARLAARVEITHRPLRTNAETHSCPERRGNEGSVLHPRGALEARASGKRRERRANKRLAACVLSGEPLQCGNHENEARFRDATLVPPCMTYPGIAHHAWRSGAANDLLPTDGRTPACQSFFMTHPGSPQPRLRRAAALYQPPLGRLDHLPDLLRSSSQQSTTLPQRADQQRARNEAIFARALAGVDRGPAWMLRGAPAEQRTAVSAASIRCSLLRRKNYKVLSRGRRRHARRGEAQGPVISRASHGEATAGRGQKHRDLAPSGRTQPYFCRAAAPCSRSKSRAGSRACGHRSAAWLGRLLDREPEVPDGPHGQMRRPAPSAREGTRSRIVAVRRETLGRIFRRRTGCPRVSTPRSTARCVHRPRHQSIFPEPAGLPCAGSRRDSAALARRTRAPFEMTPTNIRAADGCRPWTSLQNLRDPQKREENKLAKSTTHIT